MSDLVWSDRSTDNLCINHGYTHIRDEPLTLCEIVAMYWLPKKVFMPFIAKGTRMRCSARELGLPVVDKGILTRRYRIYTRIVQTSLLVLFPLSIIIVRINRLVDQKGGL